MSSRLVILLLLAMLALGPVLGQVQFPDAREEGEEGEEGGDAAALRDARGRRCVPLPDCEAYFYLVRNRDDIPGMSRRDVFE